VAEWSAAKSGKWHALPQRGSAAIRSVSSFETQGTCARLKNDPEKDGNSENVRFLRSGPEVLEL
jgi:hypothetical protein